MRRIRVRDIYQRDLECHPRRPWLRPEVSAWFQRGEFWPRWLGHMANWKRPSLVVWVWRFHIGVQW